MSADDRMSVVTIAVGVLRNEFGQVLIARRHDDAHQGGLWEFPGGKVEPGETVQQALLREFDEELGLCVTDARRLRRVGHDYGDRRVLLDVHEITAVSGEAHGREGQPIDWVAPEVLWRREFPAANLAIIRAVMLPSLLAITGKPCDDFELRVQRALDRGAGLLQLRLGDAPVADSGSEAAQLALRVRERCRQAGARVVINATPEVALALGMDGVHLNRQRLMALAGRPFDDLPGGERMLIGASCHSASELQQAVAVGADYAMLSPVLATASHPGEPFLGWQWFSQLVADAPIPIYALGGMQRGSLELARSHGAHGIALLGALWNP